MNNFGGVRLVCSDDGKHGQNKLGSDSVEHRHGILALFHLSLIVVGEVVLFAPSRHGQGTQVEHGLQALVGPLRDPVLGADARSRRVFEGGCSRVTAELPAVLEEREALGSGNHSHRCLPAHARNGLQQLSLMSHRLVLPHQTFQFLFRLLNEPVVLPYKPLLPFGFCDNRLDSEQFTACRDVAKLCFRHCRRAKSTQLATGEK